MSGDTPFSYLEEVVSLPQGKPLTVGHSTSTAVASPLHKQTNDTVSHPCTQHYLPEASTFLPPPRVLRLRVHLETLLGRFHTRRPKRAKQAMQIPRLEKGAAPSNQPRTACLVVAILSVQLLLLLSSRTLLSGPLPSSSSPHPQASFFAATNNSDATTNRDAAANKDATTNCPLGRVYVYDLPAEYNSALIEACDELNPWNSRCTSLANSGFGLPSTDLVGYVPEELLPTWFATDQFTGEIIYHRRMLGHRCRTTDPSAATAFYLPFYAGFTVGKYLWSSVPNHTYTAEDRDRLCRQFLDWIAEQPYWKRSGGTDHFMMLGRITWDFRRSSDHEGWGGRFLYMPGMSNVTRLLIERNPWDDLDVGVPYPTGFHPRDPTDVKLWQEHLLAHDRPTLFCFAGAPRKTFKDDFRALLLSQCEAAALDGGCRSLDCSGRKCANTTGDTLALFLESHFCLQPRGDSFTRRSVFDCMIAGAIPVFFWRRSADVMYEWHLPVELEEYAVLIDSQAVRNGSAVIREVLEGIGLERRTKMRAKVVELLPKLVYAQPQEGIKDGAGAMDDAFDVAVEGVLRRFRNRKGPVGRQ